MCGIVAYIGPREAYPIILKGLKRLEYRGYDSSGVALLNNDLRVYKKKGKVLVSIASWAKDDVYVQLNINWKKLGIDPAKATITAPEVKNFQQGKTFKLNEKIPVEKGKGRLLIIQ